MFERTAIEEQLTREVARRSLLKAGGLAVAASALPKGIGWTADRASELYDAVVSPENILRGPIAALEPREDDRPVVERDAQTADKGSTAVNVAYQQRGRHTELRLPSGMPLHAEHTATPLDTSDVFTSAGVAVITTAEGLTEGEQAYAKLFRSKTQTVAVGYDHGLYVFEPALAQTGQQTGGEWVRLMASATADKPESIAKNSTPWRVLQQAAPREMLIQEVVTGTETLRNLGYRPFSAVLPSTRMPEMRVHKHSPDHFAQHPDEVAAQEKPYFITANGEMVDISHLHAKAGETLSLYAQLQYQQLTGEQQPTASILDSSGSPAEYVFAVDPLSVQAENMQDTTFSIMNTLTMLTEGVSQRYATEKLPFTNRLSSKSGMSHEDMFTNSLGIASMLEVIRQPKVAVALEESMRLLSAKHSALPREHVRHAVEQVIADIKPLLVTAAVDHVVAVRGMRATETQRAMDMPLGIYPLIPVKLTDKDAATPSRINLHAAGVRTDNPNVRYRTVNTPAMRSAMSHLLGKIGL